MICFALLLHFMRLISIPINSKDVFPMYWKWLYWCIPSSWAYRALVINQFISGDYPEGVGEAAMESLGFVSYKGNTFGREWIGYAFIYLAGCIFLSMFLAALCLHKYPMEAKQSGNVDAPESVAEIEETKSEDEVEAENTFIPVNLTFHNLSYEVKASTGSKTLRLLNDVSGMFRPGRSKYNKTPSFFGIFASSRSQSYIYYLSVCSHGRKWSWKDNFDGCDCFEKGRGPFI